MSHERRWKFRVQHILDAVAKIQKYTAGMTPEGFAASDIAVDAVIRNFQIIGEAARRVPDDIQARHSEIPWSQMQGMRHTLVHGYDTVRLEIVWKTIRDNLPQLIEPLRKLLREAVE